METKQGLSSRPVGAFEYGGVVGGRQDEGNVEVNERKG